MRIVTNDTLFCNVNDGALINSDREYSDKRMMDFEQFIAKYQSRTDQVLREFLPSAEQSVLHPAMFYAVFNGGKRFRPLLVYAVGCTLGVDDSDLDGPACAVELMHAYSLVHDDLPAMDDDDLRRGQPTCHIAFDEATAILAGDALQTLAFEVLATYQANQPIESRCCQLVYELAHASGAQGMGGGQAMDLAATAQPIALQDLEHMHSMKTGALITACVRLAALCAPDISSVEFETLTDYAKAIGLAYQVQDDILDLESDTITLGKPQGSDVSRNKATFPALMGIDNARNHANGLIDKALQAIANMTYNTELLTHFAQYIIQRKH